MKFKIQFVLSLRQRNYPPSDYREGVARQATLLLIPIRDSEFCLPPFSRTELIEYSQISIRQTLWGPAQDFCLRDVPALYRVEENDRGKSGAPLQVSIFGRFPPHRKSITIRTEEQQGPSLGVGHRRRTSYRESTGTFSNEDVDVPDVKNFLVATRS